MRGFTGTNEDGYIRSNIPEFFIDNNHHTIRKYSDLNEAMKQQTDYNTKKETSNPAYSYFPVRSPPPATPSLKKL